MDNWKRGVVAGAAGAAAILLLTGRRPASLLLAGVGLAVLASEYPEKFEEIRENIPSYVRQGTRFLDMAVKVGTKFGQLAESRGRRMWEEIAES